MDDNSRKRPLSGQWLIDTVERVGQKPRVGSLDAGNVTSNFSGPGIQHSGQGNFNVGGDVNITSNNAVEENCLRDLFITDPFEDRTALKRKKGNRAAGTCEWILETEELVAWLDQEQTSNVLWLYGNPGTGKSTMAIFLTEKLAADFSASGGKTLAFFFCDSSFDKRRTATSVIRGLLSQLVEQHRQLLKYILPKYKERGADLFKSFDALWTIFMAAAADEKTGQKYCLIDAIDECDRESQNILLQQFQETFVNQTASSKIRILITSRPYSEIYEYLNEFANKDLASFPQAKKDIDLCIEERVADLVKRKRYTNKIRQQVVNILRDKAEGTFLWVGLACEELKEIPSKDAVKVLQNMPKGLHSLYEALLNRAQDESEADMIRRILGLVVVCMWPLTVLELSEACQLHQEEEDNETRIQFTRDQIASCRLMIIIQDEQVLLLHKSVKDYLVGASSDYFIDELEAHANIVYRCVNLLIEDFHGREQSSQHFFFYAVINWPEHARMAQSRFEVRDSEAEFFQVISPSRQHWLKTLSDLWVRLEAAQIIDSPSPHMSILHIAGRWGIDSLVDYITNQYYQESSSGSLVSVIDLECADSANGNATPMEMAARWGYISVISKLLCLGAEVNHFVVIAALENWRNSEEVMAFLLDQITITEDIIIFAARQSKKEVMALFFDRRGDQITITEGIVKAAAENPRSEVIALLLDQRGDEIIITEDIVKAAAENSRSEVIALLLDQRKDQIIITEDIVKAAAENSESEVIALLLDQRKDQIIITEDIVKAAVGNWDKGKEIITLFLNQRENEIIITEDIIKAAAGNGKWGKEIILLFLDFLDRCGDEIIITEDIMKAAAGNGYNGEEIITLLLNQRGDEIIITEDIMQAAAGNRKTGTGIITLLLDHCGNQITITEDFIEIAASCHQFEILNILSQQNLITSDWDKWYRISNFFKAATQGDVHTIEQLLDQGVNPDLKAEFGFTPLSYAACNGHEAVVNVLVQRADVNINSQTSFGYSPLSLAAEEGHERTVTILLDAGADPELEDVYGYMAADKASENGYERIAEIIDRVG
ncbi:hypothetical protein GGI42DRAFT_14446 [Trichoderma sp. SZMC 28013]